MSSTVHWIDDQDRKNSAIIFLELKIWMRIGSAQWEEVKSMIKEHLAV
jgi:hypothetical protein